MINIMVLAILEQKLLIKVMQINDHMRSCWSVMIMAIKFYNVGLYIISLALKLKTEPIKLD